MLENGETQGTTPEETNVDNNSEETTQEVETLDNEVSDLQEQLKKNLEEVGSLKRELKDAIKKASNPSDKKAETTNTDNDLAQKAFLRSAQITEEDEVELALETAQKWNVGIDKLVDDVDFQMKLERLRTDKANTKATSGIKGQGSSSNAKNQPEYWIAKGTPATREDVPNDKVRRQINKAFLNANKGGGKTFYND